MLCTTAIPCEAAYCKGSTPGACNSNVLMGVALCKLANSYYAHTKQGVVASMY